jgi:hypothetical protein
MLAFVALARIAPGPKIRTTAVVDVVLSAALAVALVLHLLPRGARFVTFLRLLSSTGRAAFVRYGEEK